MKLITILTITILLAACGQKEEKKQTEPKAEQVQYNLMSLQSRPIIGNVQLPGVMQPFQFVQLYPKLGGFVKSISVDRGTMVRQGQVLMTLEAPEIEQQVVAAHLKYTQALAVYTTSKDRYRRLLETIKTPGTISPYDLEAAASKMQGDSATTQGEYANFKAQEAQKAYLTVHAPFDGVITERNIHPGALAGPGVQNGKPMLVLQQLSKLRLVVDVPEQYAMQVKDGDKVKYKSNAMPGKEFVGIISRSSQSLNNNYRSETIEIDVNNADNQFKPGMYAEVILPTSGSADAFIVPKSALITTTEHKYIVVAENSKAHIIDVTEGNQSPDSTEIFGNLHTGQQVIINTTYRMKDGDEVK